MLSKFTCAINIQSDLYIEFGKILVKKIKKMKEL